MILALLDSAGDGLPRRQIGARLAFHASERQVTRDLEALRERGLIAFGRPRRFGAVEARQERWMNPLGGLRGSIGGLMGGL